VACFTATVRSCENVGEVRGKFAELGPPAHAWSLKMDLKLKPFDFAQAVARAGLRPDGTPLSAPASPDAAGAAGGFQTAMSQALQAVSRTQSQASTLQRELQMDNPSVSLEQTMVAMQKSQVGFAATLAVRNRLVQAYSDIMNMQV
jgi:flagellar hook-basal body complex protein FliE